MIEPAKLDLSQFTSQVRDSVVFSIRNVSTVDLVPNLVAAPPGWFRIYLPTMIPAGTEKSGMIQLAKEKLEFSFEKSITLEFDDEKQSRFTIPIKRVYRPTEL